jgi:hypothetical protein
MKLEKFTALKAENERLRAALSRYGLHEKGCGAFDHHAQCTCGFDAVNDDKQDGL